MLLLALKRGEPSKDLEAIIEKFKDTAGKKRVRCPACGWQPEKSARWHCVDTGAPEHFSPGCGTQWNTFETGGKCPGCSHQWTWTACLKCNAWAKHEDWYEPEADD